MISFLVTALLIFFDLFVNAFNILLIVRIIMSWVMEDIHGNWFGQVIFELTEPVLGPVRRLIPGDSPIDWSPMITVLGLYALRLLVFGLLFH